MPRFGHKRGTATLYSSGEGTKRYLCLLLDLLGKNLSYDEIALVVIQLL